ncbi:MAG TPA: alpha/beta hydrolase-fold protein [Candidatus Bathyarchaeia archaeon]|nr:alpha/beta hydrolase-fold protein [Candidatus Bathyarchaeia archaeon]
MSSYERLKPKLYFIILCSLLLVTTLFYLEIQIPKQLELKDENKNWFIFHSAEVNDDFKIYISLPDNYNTTLVAFPVIYLLDGDWYFDGSNWRMGNGGVKRIITDLAEEELIEESILVAIGYPNKNHRLRDYLYPHDFWISPSSGGANEFYSFLNKELLPYVDTHYRTLNETDRTLIGHSYGGFFALFTLFKYRNEYPIMFSKFIISSVTAFYADYYLLTLESQMFEAINNTLPFQLRMSVGSKEMKNIQLGYDTIISLFTMRNYTGFNFDYQKYLNYRHTTIVRPSIIDGLTWLNIS